MRWEPDGQEAKGEASARGYNDDGSLGCTGEYDIRMSLIEL
ncbi:MAG: hypothetical protein ACOC1F_09830 [Myxococcota bacterium]